MAWYLRKSISFGPVRFNLSKGGIGTSFGVKGFRIGVRPNGRSYIHAGRHGLYFRHELGSTNSSNRDVLVDEPLNFNEENVITHDTISASQLHTTSRKELLSQLNWSNTAFRIDILVGCIAVFVCLCCWISDIPIFTVISLILGFAATLLTIKWENKRRTIYLDFEFENNDTKMYEKIIDAFNIVANNNMLWSKDQTTILTNTHISKLNAGAGSLVNRFVIHAGTGNPPWVRTNLSMPVLRSNGKTLYFIPDGILVYDSSGVGIVDYNDLFFDYNITRFIEDGVLPNDATIVDYTWAFPNKNGGPDRRFNNNKQIPICEYGEFQITTRTGTLVYVMTSKCISASHFCNAMKSTIK